jgi:hypothetical protein
MFTSKLPTQRPFCSYPRFNLDQGTRGKKGLFFQIGGPIMRFSSILQGALIVFWLVLTIAHPAYAERKVALVVGNSS